MTRPKTPEALATSYLAKLIPGPSEDSLLRWGGAIESDAPDASENHDEYLGRALLTGPDVLPGA